MAILLDGDDEDEDEDEGLTLAKVLFMFYRTVERDSRTYERDRLWAAAVCAGNLWNWSFKCIPRTCNVVAKSCLNSLADDSGRCRMIAAYLVFLFSLVSVSEGSLWPSPAQPLVFFVGLVLELFYLTLFYIYGDNKQRKKMSVALAVEAITMAAIAAVTLTVFHTHAKRSTFVGAFCVAFAILMYASPLTVMYKVCRDKSVEYMPFWLSFTGFVNGIVWVAYAFLQFDLNILVDTHQSPLFPIITHTISNGTGAVLGAVQLLLWTYYRAIYPKCCAGDARQTDIEIMAATKVQDQL
uniref:Bidirectional sugar transporter SWEET n=1 Tax=Kalanchoe fedtschenkoi TaxID=63787 RepID=A0A7N0ZY46_KALFE